MEIDGTRGKFTPVPYGLYYCDTKQIERPILVTVGLNPDQINTVKKYGELQSTTVKRGTSRTLFLECRRSKYKGNTEINRLRDDEKFSNHA